MFWRINDLISEFGVGVGACRRKFCSTAIRLRRRRRGLRKKHGHAHATTENQRGKCELVFHWNSPGPMVAAVSCLEPYLGTPVPARGTACVPTPPSSRTFMDAPRRPVAAGANLT